RHDPQKDSPDDYDEAAALTQLLLMHEQEKPRCRGGDKPPGQACPSSGACFLIRSRGRALGHRCVLGVTGGILVKSARYGRAAGCRLALLSSAVAHRGFPPKHDVVCCTD